MFKYGCTCARRCPHHPRWDLGRLKRLARSADTSEIGLTRAKSPTAKRRNLSIPQAEVYVRQTVREIVDADFVESIWMTDVWFDVYALYRDGLGWYVKLNEGDDGVVVISHHEPERPITTIANVTIFDIEPSES